MENHPFLKMHGNVEQFAQTRPMLAANRIIGDMQTGCGNKKVPHCKTGYLGAESTVYREMPIWSGYESS
jgi:hypothetical protein